MKIIPGDAITNVLDEEHDLPGDAVAAVDEVNQEVLLRSEGGVQEG